MKKSEKLEYSLSQEKKSDDGMIEVPSDASYIKKVSDRILGELKERNLDESTLFDIRLCVEEAVANAMKYGNKFNETLSVKVSYELDAGRLCVTVEDRGEGFDHENIPDPTLEENILRGGGRGVFLIRNLMDEVFFNEKGNSMTMVKKLN